VQGSHIDAPGLICLALCGSCSSQSRQDRGLCCRHCLRWKNQSPERRHNQRRNHAMRTEQYLVNQESRLTESLARGTPGSPPNFELLWPDGRCRVSPQAAPCSRVKWPAAGGRWRCCSGASRSGGGIARQKAAMLSGCGSAVEASGVAPTQPEPRSRSGGGPPT
jgi:hypothetical protein